MSRQTRVADRRYYILTIKREATERHKKGYRVQSNQLHKTSDIIPNFIQKLEKEMQDQKEFRDIEDKKRVEKSPQPSEQPKEKTAKHNDPIVKFDRVLTNTEFSFMVYYFLDFCGRGRNETNLADIARFMHAITGKQITNDDIDNSTYFKKLKNIPPNNPKDIEALNNVKLFFAECGLSTIVETIDKQVVKLEKERKIREKEKSKY